MEAGEQWRRVARWQGGEEAWSAHGGNHGGEERERRDKEEDEKQRRVISLFAQNLTVKGF